MKCFTSHSLEYVRLDRLLKADLWYKVCQGDLSYFSVDFWEFLSKYFASHQVLDKLLAEMSAEMWQQSWKVSFFH